MIKKQQIAGGSLAGRRALGGQGRSALSFYTQLRTMIVRELGEDSAKFLAEPVTSGNGEYVDWYAEVISPPQRLSEIDDYAHKRALRALTERRRTDLLAIGEKALVSESSSLQVLGEVLMAIMADSPDERDVFIVDDNPVLTFWGYSPDLRDPIEPTVNKKTKQQHDGQNQEDSRRKESKEEARYSGFYLSTFSWCVLLSVTLALFSAFVTHWLPKIQQTVSNTEQTWRELQRAKAQETALRRDIEQLANEALQLAANCPLTCPQVKPPTKPKAEAPSTTKPTPARPPQPFKVPKEAQEELDPSFMAGKWRSKTGLENVRTNQPLEIIYEFNTQGQGIRTIIEENNVTCSGKVKVYFENKKTLAIKDLEPAKCQDRREYTLYSIRCFINAQSTAECNGQPTEDNSKSPVDWQMEKIQ